MADQRRFRASSRDLTGLEFLAPMMHDLADEVDQLMIHVDGMDGMSDELEELAENMAMFIQAQRMNSYCIEFPQVSEHLVLLVL